MSNLRNEIAKTISEGEMYDCSSGQLADSIIDLLESQRCEWTRVKSPGHKDYYRSACGNAVKGYYDLYTQPFCPCCGRKIEVKNA